MVKGGHGLRVHKGFLTYLNFEEAVKLVQEFSKNPLRKVFEKMVSDLTVFESI